MMDCKGKQDNEDSLAFLECQVHLAVPDPKVTEDTSVIQAYQELVSWDLLDVQGLQVP